MAVRRNLYLRQTLEVVLSVIALTKGGWLVERRRVIWRPHQSLNERVHTRDLCGLHCKGALVFLVVVHLSHLSQLGGMLIEGLYENRVHLFNGAERDIDYF